MLRTAGALLLVTAPAASAYGVPLVRPASPVAARSAVVRLQQMPDEPAPQIVSEETYGLMLTTLLKTEKSIKGEISANYAMVDYNFLQNLCAANPPLERHTRHFAR